MSNALENNAADVFKLYDELVIAYSKDIEGYKEIVRAIEVMIAQKEELLQDMKSKAIHFLKNAPTGSDDLPAKKAAAPKSARKTAAAASREAAKPHKKAALKEEGAGMNDALTAGEAPEDASLQKAAAKTTGKRSAKAAGSVKNSRTKPASRKKKSVGEKPAGSAKSARKAKSTGEADAIKCLYHPDVEASDKGRQLCSSCKWKLINSGLTQFDKDPRVVAFLKGEAVKFPDLGQSMCPVHPEVPSYNRKTGLCKECQKKAKGIGIQDRPLTEDELNILRNPAL